MAEEVPTLVEWVGEIIVGALRMVTETTGNRLQQLISSIFCFTRFIWKPLCNLSVFIFFLDVEVDGSWGNGRTGTGIEIMTEIGKAMNVTKDKGIGVGHGLEVEVDHG